MSNRYLKFLCDKVYGRRDKRNFSRLLESLYRFEFYSLVPNDDNRGRDGEHLREEFLDKLQFEGPQGSSFVPEGPCTVLEMLVGLAKRLEFDLLGGEYEKNLGECFWILIENLGLEEATDDNFDENMVEKRVKILLERRYSRKGEGGLFPLRVTLLDQRKIEIWYQMSEWVIQNYPI